MALRGTQKLALEAAGTALVFAAGAYTLLNIGDIRTRLLGPGTPTAAAVSAPTSGGGEIARSDSRENRANGRMVELSARAGGHYFVEAEINGRPVAVMVDTGATMVALTYDDARRAGIAPRDSDFTHRVSTANGVARVAPVTLDRIQIGGILVRDVQAAVLEEGKLQTTLLGMSFLGKLSSFSMKQGRLILEE